jgi:glycosyltransferase involved in cell wall biosynthesis
VSKLKICVYAICKNEEKFVDPWMDSMGEADLVIVLDTGSTDNTVERLRSRGAVVYEEVFSPWRFDTARNSSLAKVPEDVDICICTDLDELLNKGWRELLESSWQKSIDSGAVGLRKGRYLYNWSLKEDGSPDVQFYYTKVHSRKGFRWKCPVHEYLHYAAKTPLITVDIDGMVLNHYPDPSKSRSSYYTLLEMGVQEAPTDDRMRYYLGREYMYLSMWEDCIRTCKEYIEMPSATWDDERCAAMRWIAKSYSKLGQKELAYQWFFKAIGEQPKMRDPFVEFALYANKEKDWELSYYLAIEALKIKEKSKTFVNSGQAWGYIPYDTASISAYYMGLYNEAYKYAMLALEDEPDNERLQNNMMFCKQKL